MNRRQVATEYGAAREQEWRWVVDTIFGEIDFVILNRDGDILIIEQKNGALEEIGGELRASGTKFNTNWKTCAHRISDYNKHLAFFQLAVGGESQEKFFVFESSTLPNNLLIKTKITKNNKDRKYIYNTLSKVKESKTPIFDISADFLNHPLFKRFPNWKEGIFVKNNYNSIRMVIKSKPI